MYISINWIKDFVNLDGIDIDSLIYKFTMSTAEVEKTEKYGFDTCGVVVGEINSIEKIENSNKLHKVLVNIGNEKVTSICGANNIKVGDKIPFAKAGSKVKGVEIKKSLVDNLESNGVCLSEKELGISLDHKGVMILDENEEVGRDIKEIMPLEDIVFEVDNKSITNRPDLWGHYGIAREIAAITKRELKPLDIDDLEVYNKLPKLDISVDNEDECYRYTGITVENITKKVSSYAMKIRLFYTGSRSINLLADITNYVMLELGQPMHAFDKKYIDGIAVKSLDKELDFTTLDNVVRKLPKGTLMIRNKNEAVAIAGIMGGLKSQITDETNSLFLESATFDSTLIRKTALKISHRTDASARYEKALDPELAKLATARFIKILKENDSNVKITSSFTDVYLKKYPKIIINIDKAFFDRYIGIDIPLDNIVETLTNLKFVVNIDGDNLEVEVPSFRATKDISNKADLVEEVSRIYGYDNIVPKSNLWKVEPVREDEIRKMEYGIKEMLALKYGLSEIHSYVWYSEEQNKLLDIDVKDNLKIVNGLNKADSTLRRNMAPTMLYYINSNLKLMPECNIFEIGRTFDYNFDNKDCIENKVIGIGLSSTKKSNEELLYNAKSIVESIFSIYKNLDVKYIQTDLSKEYSWANRINSFSIKVGDYNCGYISQIHPKIVDNINKKASIVIIELVIDNISKIQKKNVSYNRVTKYQTVNFDLSILVDDNIKYEEIEDVIKESNLVYLLGYRLISIYKDEEKLQGKKSVTIRFNIGSHEKTLLKEEIDGQMNILIDNFKNKGMNINM